MHLEPTYKHLVWIFHESRPGVTAAVDMATLPGVLGPRILKGIVKCGVQVPEIARWRSLSMIPPRQFMKYPGSRKEVFMHSEAKSRPLITAVIVLSFALWPMFSNSAGKPGQIECDVQTGPCDGYLAGRKVSFDISPKPVRAMSELIFTLAFTGELLAGEPYIDLGMPGMDMGRNRVVLKPMGDGTFQGTGVIVRCPSGRRTWRAKVTVPDIGSAEFVFDVIY